MPLQVKIAPVSPSSRRRNSGRSPAGKKYRSVSCENLNCETGAKCDNEIGTTDAIRRRHDGPSSKKDQGVAKQSAASSESGNTVVDIGHQVGVTLEELNESSSYLHWYYEIACFLCVVPWRRGRKPKSPLMLVQWIIYGFLTTLSLLHTCVIIKHYAMHYDATEKLYRYIKTGFYIVAALSKVYFVKLHLFDGVKVDRVLRCFAVLKIYLTRHNAEEEIQTNTKKYIATVLAIGVSPIVLSILRASFFVLSFNEWSVRAVIQQWAYNLGVVAFVWDWDDQNRLNATEKIGSAISENDSSAQWSQSLGIFGIVVHACGSMQEYAMMNLLLAIGLSFRKFTNGFKRVIRGVKGRNPWGYPGLSGSPLMDKIWNFYQCVRTTSQEINNCYGQWMKSVHVNNILMLAFFILLCVTNEHTEVTFCSYLYKIAITLFTYYIATIISDTNSSSRLWIKWSARKGPTVEIHGESRCVQVLLDDIRQKPIGLGSGNFFIDESFLIRFFGMKTSLLFFLSENEIDNDIEDEDNEE